MSGRLRRWLGEPLLHFLALGALIFVAYAALSPGGSPGDRRIVVTPALVEHLAETFALTWQRPPSESEIRALVEDHVKEEILYREALALGLDRDDVVVRRRLRQKMEFLSEDVALMTEPNDDDLRAYLAAHPDDFRRDAIVGFVHVFLSPERRGAALKTDAARVLAALRRGDAAADTAADVAASFGDPFLLPSRFEGIAMRDVASQLGESFASALAAAPVGEWTGPVASSYGAHLIRVSTREDARLPTLEENRELVEREWRAAERRKANEAFYAKLRERYVVSIEMPVPTGANSPGTGEPARAP